MNDDASIDDWNEYLDDLYLWISEKYTMLMEDGDYTEEHYQKDFQYYEEEKARIEEKFAHLNDSVISEKTKQNSFLSQSNFESFFGVTIEETPVVEEKLQEQKTRLASEEYKERRAKIEEQMLKNYQNNAVIEKEVTPEESIDFTVFDEKEKTDDKPLSILLIGDSTSGRTSIRRALMGKHFVDRHLTTIGASMDSKLLDVDGKEVNITLVDLGGQDFYKSVRSNFYRNIDGALIVFDLSKRESFMRLDHWVTEFYRSIKSLVPFIIVGNKMDIKTRMVKEKEGARVAENYSRKTLPRFKVRYLETSAKNNTNIQEAFEIIVREIKAFKTARKKRRQSH